MVLGHYRSLGAKSVQGMVEASKIIGENIRRELGSH
jgi:hypothetical protein